MRSPNFTGIILIPNISLRSLINGNFSQVIKKFVYRYVLKDLEYSDKLKNVSPFFILLMLSIIIYCKFNFRFCQIPENNAMSGFCTGLVCAWTLYEDNE